MLRIYRADWKVNNIMGEDKITIPSMPYQKCCIIVLMKMAEQCTYIFCDHFCSSTYTGFKTDNVFISMIDFINRIAMLHFVGGFFYKNCEFLYYLIMYISISPQPNPSSLSIYRKILVQHADNVSYIMYFIFVVINLPKSIM